MSKVKAGGKVRQHPQSRRHGKRLGVKKFGGESIATGQIILRQRGERYKLGKGTGMGKDQTIFAMIDGIVAFGKRLGRTTVSVLSK
jgi:large subunit ribosomal protein L27